MRRTPQRFSSAGWVVLAAALFIAGCATTTDAERALLDEAIERYNSENGLDPDEFADDDPFGLEVERTAEIGLDIGVVSRLTPPADILQFACPFDTSRVSTARCGRVTLPGHGMNDDYEVEIAFVRFAATGDAADIEPDPLVYLHGGPGGSILDDADYWYDTIVSPHIERRDVILYDQRGGGRSTKLPFCSETTAAVEAFYLEPASHESLTEAHLVALAECGFRLDQRQDVDLTAYTSSANAQDLVDLMWALGVQTYNIHGSSYGTRLAQTVMRDNPEGVRSLVLSGAYPIQESLMGSIPQSLEASLDAVFAACANTVECKTALPDPWGSLEALVAELDANPVPISLGSDADPYDFVLDGTDLINALHNFAYVGANALSIPDLLIDWQDDDARRVRRLAGVSIFTSTDIAAFVLVQCADEARFTTADELARPLRHEFLRAADLGPALNGIDSLTICGNWAHAATAENENEPVVWGAPTLVLSGGLDPITPPWWAETLAAQLPNGRLVNFPGASHDSDESFCATNLIGQFVETPTVAPDTGCTVEGPLAVPANASRFEQPLEWLDWSLDLDADGELFAALVPDWSPVYFDNAEIFWRDLGPLDPTSVVVLPEGTSYDPISHLTVYETDLAWRPLGTALVDGWLREAISSFAGDLIRYVNTTTGVQVVLVTEISEPDDLETLVLAPVAASIGDAE